MHMDTDMLGVIRLHVFDADLGVLVYNCDMITMCDLCEKLKLN